MENDVSPDVIQERMQETRNSLTDKVAMLEEQVMGTVQTATTAVQSTVQTATEAVHSTVEAMKETVQDVRSSVERTFDIPTHVRERPWLALGIAVASGFAIGRLVFPGEKKLDERMRDEFTPPAPLAQPLAASTATQPSAPSWFDRLMERAGDELYTLGESALNQAMDALKKSVHDGVPRLISEVEHRITGNGHHNGIH